MPSPAQSHAVPLKAAPFVFCLPQRMWSLPGLTGAIASIKPKQWPATVAENTTTTTESWSLAYGLFVFVDHYYNRRIGTAATSGRRTQSNRQSLRFALTSHSFQSENIGSVTQERIKDSLRNSECGVCIQGVSQVHSARTMRRRVEMKAIKLIAALVVCSMATSVQAGLFGHFKSNHGCGCSVEPTCCAPVEASCCAPAGCGNGGNGCGPAVEASCCAPAACGVAAEPTCCAPVEATCCAPAACGGAVEATCCAPADCCNTCGDGCGCGTKSCFKMPKFKLPKFKMPKFKLPKCNLFGGSGCGSSCCSEPSCCAPAACEPSCCAPVEASCCAPAGCN